MSKEDTRNKILKAAANIVQSNGILDLTLEAAAVEAGISKGGLLYHYPSKNALIEGMIQNFMQSYADNIKLSAKQDVSQEGKWTRAFINETFQQSTTDRSLDAGLMAAAALNPELLGPMQDAYGAWQQHIEDDGIDPIHATILRLAVDGLWFSELFSLAPLEEGFRNEILDRLLLLTRKKAT